MGSKYNNRILKIMIVDDDVIIRMVLKNFAERRGWQVFLAEDGLAALDVYQKYQVDVIIMDCQMVGVDGFETTAAIRKIEHERSTHTPIIALTADALKGSRETCMNAGMDDYLTKPIEMDKFYRMIEEWSYIDQ